MTNLEFVYWLKGFSALTKDENVDLHQLHIIQSHFNLVQAVNGTVDDHTETFMRSLRALFETTPSIPKKDFDEVFGLIL